MPRTNYQTQTLAERCQQVHDRLRTLERQAHALAESACNGDHYATFQDRDYDLWDDESHDALECAIILEAERILGRTVEGLFWNGDPRGYALKIEPEHTPPDMHTDFGGYGILAPERPKPDHRT